jgi:hypothetical protein
LTARHILALSGAAAIGVAGVIALRSPRTRRPALVAGAFGYAAAGVEACHSAVRLRRTRPDIVGPAFHPLAPALAPALALGLNGAWLAGLVRGALRERRTEKVSNPGYRG